MDAFGKHMITHLATCVRAVKGYILIAGLLFAAYVWSRWLIEAKQWVDTNWFD